jgi:hypothetical protein
MNVWVPGYFAKDGASSAVAAIDVSFLARTDMRGVQKTESNKSSQITPPSVIYLLICSSLNHLIKMCLKIRHMQ